MNLPFGHSDEARVRMLSSRGDPLFLADWLRTLMIHMEVDPIALQRVVPFQLDLWEGRAFISLVAFTFRRMRPRRFERLGGWLFKPIGSHDFLNFRTYVRHRGERGIHFVAEWLSSRLAAKLGPRTFGLPYRFSEIHYDHNEELRSFCGEVLEGSGDAVLRYTGHSLAGDQSRPCTFGSLDEWLMERYTAFNCIRETRKFFRVWHRPWPQVPVTVELDSCSRIFCGWPWLRDAVLYGANYSPGFVDVWMGRPHRCEA